MKKRIIITEDNVGNAYVNTDIKLRGTQTIEQIPETFEELKKLCRAIGCVVHPHDIVLYGCLVGSEMIFCEDGAIYLNTDCIFVEKLSIPQMWQIIKGLRGEE
ncbi:MAG: hypothetical protein IJK26_02890 [Clostridia bacterium]|nr:hypothetical protein [Clostridia bacterium]